MSNPKRKLLPINRLTCCRHFSSLIGTLCNRPMGMQSGRIKNHMITASSIWNVNHAAHLARLHGRRRGPYIGAWAAKYNNRYQWLQVYFGGASKIIRISTQGRQDANQWVTQYYVSHSMDRVHFSEYKERNNRKVIIGFIFQLSHMTAGLTIISFPGSSRSNRRGLGDRGLLSKTF